jgi:hypothetical protein
MFAPDPDAFEAILQRGRQALAWEVLRRNPAYRADQAVISGAQADAAFVLRWGLHFR